MNKVVLKCFGNEFYSLNFGLLKQIISLEQSNLEP